MFRDERMLFSYFLDIVCMSYSSDQFVEHENISTKHLRCAILDMVPDVLAKLVRGFCSSFRKEIVSFSFSGSSE